MKAQRPCRLLAPRHSQLYSNYHSETPRCRSMHAACLRVMFPQCDMPDFRQAAGPPT